MEWLSPQLQGALVGGLIGLVSSLSALLVQRRMRTRGEVHCEIVAWVGSAVSPGVFEEKHFEVRFFNEKEVGVGLWNVVVEFRDEEGRLMAGLYPKFVVDGRPVEVLDLPSRVPLSWTMTVTAGGPIQLPKVRRAPTVRFTADLPGGGRFEKAMPTWET